MVRNQGWRLAASGEGRTSGKALFYDFAVDIGQTALDSVVVVGQSFVIDAEQVEQGGVEVVPGNGAFGRFPADIVSGSD